MTLIKPHALLAAALLLALAIGCSSIAPAAPKPPTATAAPPTNASDNPTAGAIRLATRQAALTQSAAATQGPLASQTAAAAASALAAATGTADAQTAGTATAAARATLQALYAAEHTWPVRYHDAFADNQLGWPIGLTQDQYLAVTTTVTGGHYQWLTAIAAQGAYTNWAPSKETALGDFYAAVDIQFTQGNDEGQAAYGLAFRMVDDTFGFFGIFKSDQFLLMETRNNNVNQQLQLNSAAINTQPGATNRLAVIGIGSDFVCLINDQPIDAEIGADLGPGQIGLGVEATDKARPAEVDFSNFEVRAP